jgi:hypothetical protein
VKESRQEDDLEARLKRDPRREPTDPPPGRPDATPLPQVQVVDSSGRHHDAPAADSNQALAQPTAIPGDPVKILVRDPRVEAVESAINAGDWNQVLAKLGPTQDAGKLPPNLGILYAIAMKEKQRDDAASRELTDLAIRCTSGVLGLDARSPIALLIAKRLLRTNPVAWRQRPAPRPWISMLIVLGGLLVGAALSFLISFGYLQIHVRLP